MTADAPITAVDVVTGELVPARPAEPVALTPAQAREKADWVREMQRAVLTEGEDYGRIAGTERPTLFKSGAEMLLLAAGLGFNQIRVDDDDYREHRGVTYRCEIHRGDILAAVCEAYAGYDENRFRYRGGGKAPWNTLLKMAQKRALVGATLNAVAASGLFVADVEPGADDQPSRTPDTTTPPCDDDAVAPASAGEGKPDTGATALSGADAAIAERVGKLGPDARKAWDAYIENWPAPPWSPGVQKQANRFLDGLEADR
jgi:hypothetical protein